MSYTVLARRYRSSTFDELVGQSHIAQTLTNAIKSNRIAHAFLFTGTRGTGKTSSARILAKCLNCESSDRPTPTPCGKCHSCQAIARGDDIDVIEIDAASNTGVDNVREIIENAQFRPARARFKVYIIDEVHMLSKSAFNALLKTLEEPPEHVKFILATTEVEKVLPTILSRCQRYDFRNISTREIAAHLKKVCQKENIQADDDAILLVAKSGAGSMRDALSLLDRLLSASGDRLTTETIEQLLGLPKSQQIFDLVQLIGEGKVQDVLTNVDQIITRGLSAETLCSSLIDHFRNLLILKTCGKQTTLVEIPGLPIAQVFQQAQQFEPLILSQNIVILEELRRQLRSAAAGRALLDATLVRLALAAEMTQVDDLLAALGQGASEGIKKKYEPSLVTSPVGSVSAAPAYRRNGSGEGGEPVESNLSESATPDVSDEKDDLPAVGRVWTGGGVTSVFQAFRQNAVTRPKNSSATSSDSEQNPPLRGLADPQDLNGLMRQLQIAVSEQAPTLVGFLEGGKIKDFQSDTVTLEYPLNYQASARMLDRNGKRESIQQVLSQLLGRPVGLKILISEQELTPGESKPVFVVSADAGKASAIRPGTPREPVAESSSGSGGLAITPELTHELMENPLIRSLSETFGARIVKVE